MPTLRCVGDTQKDHDDMFALLKAKLSFYNDCEFHEKFYSVSPTML